MDIEEKIEQLRLVKRLEAPPFLWTRIRAKIETKALETVPMAWLWGGVLAYVCLAALVFWLPMSIQSNVEISLPDSYWSFQNAQLYVE